MRNFTLFVALLCLWATKGVAQDQFQNRVKQIAGKIETITTEEKAALKTQVEAVEKQLEAGQISAADAAKQKEALAAEAARKIEERTAVVEDELTQLITDKIEGKIKSDDSTNYFKIDFRYDNAIKRALKGESRTTSQFVFAFGLNNLITNSTMAGSDYRVWGSHFYEWGLTYNTRILKNHNLLHAKYGFSVQYNNLRPTENRFQVESGRETVLETFPVNLTESRLRNVNLVLPVHLELDFTRKRMEKGETQFRTHESFRIGLGGYVGANLKSKQILKFEDEAGNNVRQRTRGDFNVNDFIYGVSAYVGYDLISLYVKYDLNPVFQDNAVAQRNLSMGLRFDFN